MDIVAGNAHSSLDGGFCSSFLNSMLDHRSSSAHVNNGLVCDVFHRLRYIPKNNLNLIVFAEPAAAPSSIGRTPMQSERVQVSSLKKMTERG